MSNCNKNPAQYRLQRAVSALKVSKMLLDIGCFSDAVNRAYYGAFRAVTAMYAIDGVDYARSEAIMASFIKDYVDTRKIDSSMGRDLLALEHDKNTSDYDDFHVTSKEDAEANYARAANVVRVACIYCSAHGIDLKYVELAYYAQPDALQSILDCIPKSIFGNYTAQEIIEHYRQTFEEEM